jgi:hypothetical protein
MRPFVDGGALYMRVHITIEHETRSFTAPLSEVSVLNTTQEFLRVLSEGRTGVDGSR